MDQFKNNGWLRGKDLNLRPLGYEPNELPGCSTPRADANKALNSKSSQRACIFSVLFTNFFYYNRLYAAATSLTVGGLAAQSLNRLLRGCRPCFWRLSLSDEQRDRHRRTRRSQFPELRAPSRMASQQRCRQELS